MENHKSLEIIKFSTAYCQPCKLLKPIFTAFKEEYPNIQFTEIDAETDEVTTQKYSIRAVPTLIFLSDGTEVGRHVGALSKEQFKAKITQSFV